MGATIRVYIEQYQSEPSKIGIESNVALAPLVRKVNPSFYMLMPPLLSGVLFIIVEYMCRLR